MTYNTPELLLVGAAQNLVLDDTSVLQTKLVAICRADFPADIDNPGVESYNKPSTW